jgi:hypothetical protein
MTVVNKADDYDRDTPEIDQVPKKKGKHSLCFPSTLGWLAQAASSPHSPEGLAQPAGFFRPGGRPIP